MARILIACEESQATTKEFRALGHEAFSCDLLPCSGGHPEWHYQQDVLQVINQDWDLIIAHPPCTHLSSSGQWAFTKGIKDISLKNNAIDFFMKIANADCEKIAIENPIGVISTVWKKPEQIIQPWMFGDLASKSTCLWLKGLPKLIPKWMYDIRTKPHKVRSNLSSKTFPGIAKAFAEQWSKIL